VLSDVIASTLTEKMGVSNSKLIAVTGTKGGSGVSTIAQALAYALSDKEQQKTLIMDASGGWSYLSVAMGQEPSSTLSEAVRVAGANNDEDLSRIQVKLDDNLTLLACGGDGLFDDPVSAADYETLINKLMVHHPFVVVDLSAAPAHLARAVIQRANKTFVISAPSLPSLRAARTILKEIDDLRGSDNKDDVKFILNAHGLDKANEVNPGDIEAALETKIDLAIAYDPKTFRAAESQGKTIKGAKGAEKLILSLALFLKDIVGSDKKSSSEDTKTDGSIVGGILSKIKGN
jgi:pilus assembly protein CpaE